MRPGQASAALLLCLVAASCYDRRGNSSVDGGTFPAVTAGIVQGLDAQGPSGVPVRLPLIAGAGTDSSGRYHIGLDTTDGPVLVATAGGTYLTPGTGTLLNLATPNLGQFIPSGLPLTIPDARTTGVISTAQCTLRGPVENVRVLNVNLTHTFVADLVLTLTSPGGTSVTFFNHSDGSGDNLSGTSFDDAATATLSSSSAPFTGTFRPDAAFAGFRGVSALGTWTLNVADTVSTDVGTLTAWILEVEITPSAPRITLPETFGGDIAADSLLAVVHVDEGNKLANVIASPVSKIAAFIATFVHEVTGETTSRTTSLANTSVSSYFSDNSGLIPNASGQNLWDPRAPFTGTTLTDDVVLGLLTVGLQGGADRFQLDVGTYVTALSLDAADGTADGVTHAPFTAFQATATASLIATTASTTTATLERDYPADPLGVTLAADIEAFLLDPARNNSTITTVTARPLLDRLRSGGGRLLSDVPRVDVVYSPTTAGSRIATLAGANFQAGAQVFFGELLATSTNVQSFSSMQATVPDGFVSGTEVFVTVVNPTRYRHSLKATITIPPVPN